MFNKNNLKIIIRAISHFCNQPLSAKETVLNPIIFWQIYHRQQILEKCWNYDLIQFFDKCWTLNVMPLSDNNKSRENDSHSLGI